MKHSILTITAVFAVISVLQAQDFTKIRLGAKAGYNYSMSKFVTNKELPTKAISGGYVGAMLKIPFDGRLFFVPQIDFNYRGMQTDSLQPNQFSSVKELQVRVLPLLQIDFKHPDQKINTLFVQFGPSLGFGVNGKQIKQNGANVPVNANLRYGYQAYGMYDANWHTAFGYETIKGFRVLVEYVHGLGNMINTEDGPTLKYRTITAGVGYWF